MIASEVSCNMLSLPFVIDFSASISLKQYDGNYEKCNHQYICCDVDNCSPYRSFLGSGSNERWVQSRNDKTWIATNHDGVNNCFAGYIQHCHITAFESNKT